MTPATARDGFGPRRPLQAGGAAMVIVAFLLSPAVPPAVQAQTLDTLYQFQCAEDGCLPIGLLVSDSSGNLYGTAPGNYGGLGAGDVYELSSAGKLTVLLDFSNSGGGGSTPVGLVQDRSGSMYGTTELGGSEGNFGTVFEVTRTGSETVLYRFNGTPDGEFPQGWPILDDAGNLFGATLSGGKELCWGQGLACGTAFMVRPDGTETILHYFTGPPDGFWPEAALARGPDGSLYGTTYYGGRTTCPHNAPGCGIVFRLTPVGNGKWRETVLHRFTGKADGGFAVSALVLDAQGNIYGGTQSGGDSAGCRGWGCGTIYKITSTGNFSVLYSFTGGSDGSVPYPFLLDGGGNIYGTATTGGNTACNGVNGCGTVFELDPAGHLTVLHSFDGKDGAGPYGLIRDGEGNLYGVTFLGGDGPCDGGCGTIYKLTP